MGSAFLEYKAAAEEGDLAVVYVNFGEAMAVRVRRGQTIQTRFGALRHDYLIGRRFGSKVSTTRGHVHVLHPTPELWTQTLPHRTQILYCPDISLVVAQLELRPGSCVAEAGTGSASLTHSLARTVAPTGRVFTYEVNEERWRTAEAELKANGLSGVVTLARRNVCVEGFDVTDAVDAVFLDLPCPWEAVGAARRAIRASRGGRFCSFSPCIEQVQRTCQVLRAEGFTEVDTVELVSRSLKIHEVEMPRLRDKAGKGAVRARTGTEIETEAGERKEKREKAEEGAEENNCGEKEADAGRKAAAVAVVDEAAAAVVATCTPFPPQQPTHTGYLTFATLPPRAAV